ncbi:MAG: hypothetical protein ABJC55_16660, partial [Algoriphagus sp.]
MKRVLFMLLMAFCASTTIAQTKDSTNVARLDPKLKQSLNIADQAAYQLALRFSDMAAAKNALYNLIVRNPEDIRYIEMLASVYYEAGQSMSAALVSMEVLKIN